jgi:putative sigma-54 modulation protein
MMKVNVQTPHFKADKKLIDFTNRKLSKLEVFFARIIRANVYLRLQKSKEKQNKIVEILLSIPGGELIAKKESKTFEEGIDECLTALERKLKKKKEKQLSFI